MPHSGLERQLHVEGASLSGLAVGFHPRATAVTLNDPLANAQTEAKAVGPWTMGPTETLEDELLALRWYSEAAIGH
jgi:hypothetical protein